MKPFLPTITAAQFKRMGKRAKIVAIAKDVIARIDAEFIEAIQGNMFWRAPYADTAKKLKTEINRQVCEVCAKGALACAFVGSLNRYESLEGEFDLEGDSNSKGTQELVSIFGRELWDAIEVAFEEHSFSWNIQHGTSLADSIIASFEGIEDSQTRLRAIYANIVKNRGRMKLKDGTFIG